MPWHLLIGLAFSALSVIFRKRPDNTAPKPANLEDFNISNPDEGAVVPEVFGSGWMSPKPAWFKNRKVEPIKKDGGKK